MRTRRAKLAAASGLPRLQRQRSRPLAVDVTTHLRENPFELAREQLRRVGDTFEIDPNLISVLGECKKALEVSIPVTMDDGTTQVLRATASLTTSRAGRRRAASATTPTSRSTRSRRSRCG